MTNEQPHLPHGHRPTASATPLQPLPAVASPAGGRLIAQWLRDVPSAMGTHQRSGRAVDAMRLVILWGRIARTDPRALPSDADAVLAQLKSLACSARVLLEATAPARWENWGARWLEQASALRANEEDPAADLENAPTATRLLGELDDALLIAHVAQQNGHNAQHVEDALEPCVRLIRDEPLLFAPAEPLVRNLLDSMRPDLPIMERTLARTAEVLLCVAEAMNQVRADLDGPGGPLPALDAFAAASAGPVSTTGDLIASTLRDYNTAITAHHPPRKPATTAAAQPQPSSWDAVLAVMQAMEEAQRAAETASGAARRAAEAACNAARDAELAAQRVQAITRQARDLVSGMHQQQHHKKNML